MVTPESVGESQTELDRCRGDGRDIINEFRDDNRNALDLEGNNGVQLPEDIAEMLRRSKFD